MNHSGPPFVFQVLGVFQAVEGRFEKALEPLSLSLAKFGVLTRLARSGEPVPLSTLADMCSCVRSNMTQLVDRLEAEKLVVRVPDPRDRRSIRAELTDEGRRRQELGERAVEAVEHELFTDVPADQREAFFQLFRSLRSVAIEA